MEKSHTSIVKKPLVSWILKGSYKIKLVLLLAAIVTVLIRIVPLEMQKRIVNQAISLKRFNLLLIYCSLYLAAVFCASALKVTINFFTSFSPFIIFILGGYLAIKGQLQLGSLVAFLSAQEKLFDPWREILNIYQAYQEASVSYRRTMEYFDVAAEFEIDPDAREPYQLDGGIEVKNLSFTTEDGIQLLNNIQFSLKKGEQLALVGFSGSGKSTLAHCIGQIYRYTAVHIRIDEHEVSEMTKRDVAANDYFLRFLRTTELAEPLMQLGIELCLQTIDILAKLPDIDPIFFEQSPLHRDELSDFEGIAARLIKSGRLKTSSPQVQDTINEQIVQLLIEEDLLETILQIGMQFQVGTKGDRLSGGQRQKLATGKK